MAYLSPYTSADFELLNSWVSSAALLLLYSGTQFSYPLSASQIENYRREHPDRKMYLARLEDGTAFAFGEIIPQPGNSVRLARLLVGDAAQRGKGLGTQLVQLLLREAKETFGVPIVELNVMDGNTGAIRCYEKAGFAFVPEEGEWISTFSGPLYIHKMRLQC